MNYDLTILDQSMAPLADFDGSYHTLDVGVPPIRPHTFQCDPWCSAAMNTKVFFSDMTSYYPHAKCVVTPPGLEDSNFYMSIRCRQNSSFVTPPLTSNALPDYRPRFMSPIIKASRCTPLKSANTTTATADLVGSSLNDPTRPQVMAMRLGVSSGFTNAEIPSDIVYSCLPIPEQCLTSPEDRLPISEDDGFPPRALGAGFVPHCNAEQEHILEKISDAGSWPYESFPPFSEPSAKDDQLQGIQSSVASPNRPEGLATLPWNAYTTSLYPQIPLLKDDGHPFGRQEFEGSLKDHGDQCDTFDRRLNAEQRSSKHRVPFEYLPACRSKPKRKRRRFTNGEKAVIKYKRRTGVCGDCRQAKRRASLVMMSVSSR